MRRLAMICTLAVLTAACRAGGAANDPPAASGSDPTNDAADTATLAAGAGLRSCDDVGYVTAPAERYRDEPIYVANEQPTEEIHAWAATQPGFEELWIDREHLGWVTVAFSTGADERQADLERLFPDVGVVAVEVERPLSELEALQRRIHAELDEVIGPSSWVSVQQGVVGVDVGLMTPERVAAVAERFGDEPICVSGTDPADVPPAGPQPVEGAGWRLLADERDAGHPYRTGIASDPESYRQLWATVGLSGEPPAVDFESEVVIWFGAVYGSGCPNLRLDDVVLDEERAILHAEIVLLDVASGCGGDARPRAYLVALQRSKLPAGPFAIQLGADDPPGGAPEERTLVDVDLSRPGAVAGPGDVHGDPTLPEPFVNESGAVVEPEYPAPYRLFVHCGIEWLGYVNSVAWRTEVPPDVIDFVPEEWQPLVDDGESIELSILLSESGPTIEATANGHTVTYRATAEEPPGCD